MTLSKYNDSQLIREYQQGNEQAFSTLFKKYYPLVFNLMVQKGVPLHESEDFTSEVFISLAESLLTFQMKKPFHHYLLRIVRNKIFDYYRKKSTKAAKVNFEQMMLIQPEQIEEFELKEIIDLCLQKIKLLNRRAIVLMWMQGYKRKQIAEIFNLPIGTIHSHLERGKILMKNCIQDKI